VLDIGRRFHYDDSNQGVREPLFIAFGPQQKPDVMEHFSDA
jgi:hypothetical protein